MFLLCAFTKSCTIKCPWSLAFLDSPLGSCCQLTSNCSLLCAHLELLTNVDVWMSLLSQWDSWKRLNLSCLCWWCCSGILIVFAGCHFYPRHTIVTWGRWQCHLGRCSDVTLPCFIWWLCMGLSFTGASREEDTASVRFSYFHSLWKGIDIQ